MARVIDNLMIKAAQGMGAVKDSANLIARKAKLSAQIQDIEKEKNHLLLNLGNLIYDLQSKDEVEIEQSAALCMEISRLNQSIADMHAELRSLETQGNFASSNNGVRCACGFINGFEAKFCESCGKALKINEIDEQN